MNIRVWHDLSAEHTPNEEWKCAEFDVKEGVLWIYEDCLGRPYKVLAVYAKGYWQQIETFKEKDKKP